METQTGILPTIKIGSHDFIVDFMNGEFRQAADHKNVIPMRRLSHVNDSFSFLFDDTTAQHVRPWESTRAGIERVTIPIRASDEGYFDAKERDERLVVDLIETRNSAIYQLPDEHGNEMFPLHPLINIYGTDFLLDPTTLQFRQADNPANVIHWHDLKVVGVGYELQYDSLKKNLYQGASPEPDHVKDILLPPLDIMVRDGVLHHCHKLNDGVSKAAIQHINPETQRAVRDHHTVKPVKRSRSRRH